MINNLLATKYGAWNPGLEAQLPREYLLLSTIFRAENVSTSAAKAYELSEFCGLPELVAFHVERLIVHELLILCAKSERRASCPTYCNPICHWHSGGEHCFERPSSLIEIKKWSERGCGETYRCC
jgi:hypothetical protein